VALWFDATSVELFADDGLSSMTSLFFPHQPWRHAVLTGDEGTIASVSVQPLLTSGN
jgi:fructan beta-fructosidase